MNYIKYFILLLFTLGSSIAFSQNCSVNAGPNQNIYCPVSASIVMDGNEPDLESSGEWTVISKPIDTPDPIFSDATSYNTEVSGFKVGVYTFRWTITTGDCISFDETTITVTNENCPAPGGVTGVDFWIKSDDVGDITTAWKDHSANLDDIPAVGDDWTLSPASCTTIDEVQITADGTFCEGPDTDGDGIPDMCDDDADNDGIPNCIENGFDGDPNTAFKSNGDATAFTNPSGGSAPTNQFRLTNGGDQSGQAWSYGKIDFAHSFKINMKVLLSGADGIAIVFHNSPLGTSASGIKGQGLGARGIDNGIALELDTFPNSCTNDNNNGANCDPPYDHGSIRKTAGTATSGWERLTPTPDAQLGDGTVDDGLWHDVEVSWNAITRNLSYSFDGAEVTNFTFPTSGPNALETIFGGTTNVHFGFTGSTGLLGINNSIGFNNPCEIPLYFDTDGDGIPDYLDLDSDNDGCPDAIEGDGNISQSQLDADGRIIEDVDENGIPTVVNGGQGIGSAQDDTVNSCPIPCTGPDSDGDGIPDMCDLDDDNDGILDIDEMECLKIDAIIPTASGAENTYPNTGMTPFTATFSLIGDESQAATYIASIFGYTDIVAVGTQEDTDAVISIEFDRPVYSLDAVLDDVDIYETATLRLYDAAGNLISGNIVQEFVTYVGSGIGSVTYPEGQSIHVTTGTNAELGGEEGAVRLTLPFSIGVSRIEYEQTNFSGWNGLVLLNGCVDIDTDGDGVWDRLDLDSDNDGCPDAIEGDGGMTDAYLVDAAGTVTVGTGSTAANQNLCADGSCVDANGVPLPVSGGQGAGSAYDSTVNGCSEVCTQPGATGTPDGFTKVGITVQQKQDAWPENIPNGWITLESKEKGFVITRVANESSIADPKEGMLIYDIDASCVKLYNGTEWKCIEKSCNE